MLKYLLKKLLRLGISLFLLSLFLFFLLGISQNRQGIVPETGSLLTRYFRWISGADQSSINESIAKDFIIRRYVGEQFSTHSRILLIGLLSGVTAGGLFSYALCVKPTLASSRTFRVLLHVLRSLPFACVLMLYFRAITLRTQRFGTYHELEWFLGLPLAVYLVYHACLGLMGLEGCRLTPKEKMKYLILDWLRIHPRWLSLLFLLGIVFEKGCRYVGGYGIMLAHFMTRSPPHFFLIMQVEAAFFCLLSFLLDALMQFLFRRWPEGALFSTMNPKD